jgi:hypothetical protein
MSIKMFCRYTNLASTIHLLSRRTITLLNPATWDDKNDAYYMAEYQRIRQAQSVLALCFTESAETYHHWRVFSHGTDGVRIDFRKDRLLTVWAGDETVRAEPVEYKQIKELRSQAELSVEELPFLKRYPYRNEEEFRVVFVGMDDTEEFKDYPIDLGCIRRITLSPWMPSALAASVKETLKLLPGCADMEISHSTLTENEVWKSFTARIDVKLPR